MDGRNVCRLVNIVLIVVVVKIALIVVGGGAMRCPLDSI
jgi:hypothetical protein